jgi:hypothetical protein
MHSLERSVVWAGWCLAGLLAIGCNAGSSTSPDGSSDADAANTDATDASDADGDAVDASDGDTADASDTDDSDSEVYDGDSTPAGPHLILLSQDPLAVGLGQEAPLRAQYLSGTDTPIADAQLRFEPQGDAADTTLSAGQALTSAEGIAEVTVRAGSEPVEFVLRISAVDDDAVAPLEVEVRVAKSQPDYTVRATYPGGQVPLARVEVLLFDTAGTCQDAVPSPTQAPVPAAAWLSLDLSPEADGTIPERAVDVPDGVQLTFAVMRGEPIGAAGVGAGYFVTFGCTDGIAAPSPTETVLIPVEMRNLWPSTQATYSVEVENQLVDVIPDQYQTFIDTVGAMLSNPGVSLLQLMAIAHCAAIACDQPWYLESPWSMLFDYDGATGEVYPTTWGDIAADVLESAVLAGIRAISDVPGDTVGQIFAPGQEIFDNAEGFHLAGTLVVTRQADDAGLLGSANHMTFQTLTWVWTAGVGAFQLRDPLEVGSVDLGIVFHPAGAGRYALAINPFRLDLNYAELFVWILESVVFPTVIPVRAGQAPIDSLENFFSGLLDCGDLHDRYACEGEYGADPDCDSGLSFLADTMEASCDLLQNSAAGAIQGWLGELTADLASYYELRTPIDDPATPAVDPEPCLLTLIPDPASDAEKFVVQDLGQPTPETAQCPLDGRVHFGQVAESEPVEGDLFGTRLGK